MSTNLRKDPAVKGHAFLFIQETSIEGFFNLSMSAEEIPYASRARKSDYTYSLLDPPRLV